MELKKTWKRAIAFVLAFAMAFSFTPVTTSLAATSDSVDIAYKDGTPYADEVTLTAEDATYDGAPHAAAVSISNEDVVADGLTVTYVYAKAGVAETSNDAPTEAGDYTVTATISKDGIVDADTIDPVSLTTTFKIKKKTLNVFIPEFRRTYNTEAPVAVGVDDTSDDMHWANGEIRLDYSVLSGDRVKGLLNRGTNVNPRLDKITQATFSFSPATADAGSKTISADNIVVTNYSGMIDETANYDIQINPGTLIIDPAQLTITTPDVGLDVEVFGTAKSKYGTPMKGVKIEPEGCGAATYYVCDKAAENTPAEEVDENGYLIKPEDATYGELPSNKNKNKYKVWYNVTAANDNYTVVGVGNAAGSYIAEVVDAAAGNNLAVSLDGWTYGDKAKTPTVTGTEVVEPDLDKDKAISYLYYTAYTVGGEKTLYKVDGKTAPTTVGTYYVEATVKYVNHGEQTAFTSFTISPKTVKLFVPQPIELTADANPNAALADIKAKVTVQKADSNSYSNAAADNALVGNDKLAECFDFDLKYVEATGSVAEHVDFVAAPTVKNPNYVLAETDGYNKGTIVRKTIDLADADAEFDGDAAYEAYEKDNKFTYTGDDFVPVFKNGVKAGASPLEENVDYTVAYYDYTADPAEDADATALSGTAKTSVRDAGVYAMVLTATKTSTKVIENTRLILPFEIVKYPIYAKGFTAVDRIYDGSNAVEIKNTAKLYVDAECTTQYPGVTMSEMILKGAVRDATGNIVSITSSDVDSKVMASAYDVAGQTAVRNDCIGVEIPENNTLAKNYRIVVVAGNETPVKISPKELAIEFENKKVTKEYGVPDADVLGFKLVDTEGNEFAACDLINEHGVTITPAEKLATFNIATKRESGKEDAENVTSTGIKITVDSAFVKQFNRLHPDYNLTVDKDEYATLLIAPVSLNSKRVDATINRPDIEIAVGDTADGSQVPTVNVYSNEEHEVLFADVSNDVDVVIYRAMDDDRHAANTEAQILRADIPTMSDGYYVARISPRTGANNITGSVDVPFSISKKRITVVLTKKAGTAIKYNKDSKVLSENDFTVKVKHTGDDQYANVDGDNALTSLFRMTGKVTVELGTNGAGQHDDVKVTYRDTTNTYVLTDDVDAGVVDKIMSPTYAGEGYGLRVVVDSFEVEKAQENDGEDKPVKIETRKVALDPATPDVLTDIAAMWTYGDEPEELSVVGYEDAITDGKQREIEYKWYKADGETLTVSGAAENGDGAAENGGMPTFAGEYKVKATVKASANYKNVTTEAQTVIIEKAPLKVNAKAGSKYYKEKLIGAGGAGYVPVVDSVDATSLKGAEAAYYATLTRSSAQKAYLAGMINANAQGLEPEAGDIGLAVVVDKDVTPQIQINRAALETYQAGTYDIVQGTYGVAGVYARNYSFDLVSAEYTILPIDLTGENVTATYLDENGDLIGITVDGAIVDKEDAGNAQDAGLMESGIIIADGKEHYPLVAVKVAFEDYSVVLTKTEDYRIDYYDENGNRVTVPQAVGKYTFGVAAIAKKTVGENKQASFEISNNILEFGFKTETLTYGDESFEATIDWDNVGLTTIVKGLAVQRVLNAANATDAKILKDLKAAIGEDTKYTLSFQANDENAGNAGEHTMAVDTASIEESLGSDYSLTYTVPAVVDEQPAAGVKVEIAKRDLSNATIEQDKDFDFDNITYVPGGVEIDSHVRLVDGELLDPDHDYVCEYTNNKAIGKATLKFNANAKVGSNYTGFAEFEFDVKVASIEDAIIENDSVEFSGVEQTFNWNTARVYVIVGQNEDGTNIERDLTNGVDFVPVTDDPEYPAKGTEIGTYKVKIQGKGNYSDQTFAEGVFEITPIEVGVTGITVQNKEYDGTTTLVMSGEAVLDQKARALGWTIKKQPTSAVAKSKNAGVHDVILEGFELETTNENLKDKTAQYALVPYVDGKKLTVEISPKVLTTFTGLKLADKEYDGKKTMTLEGTAKLTGAIENDDVYLKGFEESYEADTAAVGVKTVNADPAKIELDGEAKINYTYVKPDVIELTGEITQKPVKVTGLTIKEKTYDGSAEVEIDGVAAIEGVIAGESVTFEPASKTVTLASADAGEGTFKIKKEDIQAALKGDTKDNYIVSEDVDVTGKINPAEVTIEGDIKLADKVYDGKANMTVDASAATLKGVIPGEEAGVQIDIAKEYSVADSNVGDKTAKVTVALAGEKAKNYVLKNAEYEAKGKITPVEVTVKVGSLKLKQRAYDQTTTMEVIGEATLEGVLDADKETVKLAGVPEKVEVSNPNYELKKYTIKAADLSLTGTGAANYTIKAEDLEIEGWIKKRMIEIKEGTVKMQNKVYDGSPALKIVANPVLEGVLDGDVVTVSYTGAKQLATQYGKESTRANVGDKGKWIARSKFPLAGAQGKNYYLGHAVKVMGKITAAKISTVTLKATTAKYTGKAITPVISAVKSNAGVAVAKNLYKVTYYKYNTTSKKYVATTTIKAKGKYKVRVTGTTKNVTGYKEVAFTVK